MKSVGIKPYVWMLCGCGWFSIMALTARSLADTCDWQVVAVFRSGLACLIAFSVAKITKTPLVFLRPRMLWVRSISGSCSMVAGFYAFAKMDTSTVLTFTNTFPVWVALLSWPLLREKPTSGVWIAVLCAVLGVGVTLRPFDGAVPFQPAASAVFASLTTAIAMLGLNRLKGVKPLAVILHFSFVSTLFSAAALLVFPCTHGIEQLYAPITLVKLGVVGLTGTIGQLFLTWAFSTGSATKVSVVGLSQVALVMFLEAMLGWKTIDLLNVVGTTLVLGPTGWLMARERKPPIKPDETDLAEAAIE